MANCQTYIYVYMHVTGQERCRDILQFAAAESRDVRDGLGTGLLCPVLTAMKSANLKKSDSKLYI